MLVTFSSDYGPTDAYVGICHLVIARIAPDVRVIDLAHGLQGVRGGAHVLAQSVAVAPPCVHLAVVDPGVGTKRRAVVVAAADGSMLVGPDNGLLPPAADVLGGVTGAFELSNPSYQLQPVSATFHGREIFAPSAAHLALGVPPEEFGPRVDDLVRLQAPHVEVSDGFLAADVLFGDWYGNLVLAAGAEDLAASGLVGDVLVSGAGGEFDARVGTTFADAEPGGLVVYVDSGGDVAVARNGGSARELLQDPPAVTVRPKS